MKWYRVWVLVAAVATTAGLRAPLGATGVESAVLKRLASRLDARIGVLTIEASAPVPLIRTCTGWDHSAIGRSRSSDTATNTTSCTRW